MISKIKWAILGTSPISAVMANAIQASKISELVAIGSRAQESAISFAKQFSIPNYETDYSVLLNDHDIDAFYLGLPNHLHKEWIIRCAQHGKHVLCEKPLVLNVKEAQEVFSATRKANVICMEALMYYHHPLTKKLQEIVYQNKLGKIKLLSAIYTADIALIANKIAGGSILNLGCYPISLVRLLANAEPISINAIGRLNEASNHDHQATIILTFSNDLISVVSTADDLEMSWQFEIYGTEGSLKMITNPWLPDHHNKMIIKQHDKESEEITVTADQPLYTYQIDAMGHAISNRILAEENALSAFSLGNANVLEISLKQVKSVTS